MGTIAARSELELQQLKSEAPGKALAAFSEVRWHGREEDITLHSSSPSLALRGSAEPVFWSV